MMKYFFIAFLTWTCCCLSMMLVAQPSSSTSGMLSESVFLRKVRQNHPVAIQADNLNRQASSELLRARGGFDPKLQAEYENKTFDGKNYFTTGDYALKIPTYFGTEVKAAYNTANGVFLNASDQLPNAGQGIIGLSQPILQGLLFDERRANLRLAKQSQSLNEAQRHAELNDLYLQAIETYWKWVFANGQQRIYENALEAATTRFKNIRTSYLLGERMAMDTLESFIQVQDRQNQLNEATIEYQESLAKMLNFAWADQTSTPINVNNYIPENPTAAFAAFEGFLPNQRFDLQRQLRTTHPLLRMYAAKGAQLNIERRLKLEKLKPKLNVNYNFLGNGIQFPTFLADNYKWGIGFSAPLFYRAERGDLQLAKLKIENNDLTIAQKSRELENKLQIALSSYDNTLAQLTLYTNTLENYRQLLQMEIARFELGESTFFLINSREMKYIDAQVKLLKYQCQWHINKAGVYWANGTLHDQ